MSFLQKISTWWHHVTGRPVIKRALDVRTGEPVPYPWWIKTGDWLSSSTNRWIVVTLSVWGLQRYGYQVTPDDIKPFLDLAQGWLHIAGDATMLYAGTKAAVGRVTATRVFRPDGPPVTITSPAVRALTEGPLPGFQRPVAPVARKPLDAIVLELSDTDAAAITEHAQRHGLSTPAMMKLGKSLARSVGSARARDAILGMVGCLVLLMLPSCATWDGPTTSVTGGYKDFTVTVTVHHEDSKNPVTVSK